MAMTPITRILDKESMTALVKIVIFMGFTGAASLVLALTLQGTALNAQDEYKAVFEDVTGVVKSDDVRISGVSVGSVKKVEIYEDDKAIVTFGVDKDIDMPDSAHVTLRFRNLVGQRYVSVDSDTPGTTVQPGHVYDLDHTTEALDLNVLLNGFKPLFRALSPDDTNKLAYELIQTVQGEGGSVKNLLARTASLTSTLADRDELIGDTIVNLSDVLKMIGDRDQQLSTTIDSLQTFVTGLKTDRKAILDSLDSISGLTNETADLLAEGRAPLTQDIKNVRALSSKLADSENLGELEESLQILPIKMKKVGNTSSSGSIFNFYLCQLKINLPDVDNSPLGQVLSALTSQLQITQRDDRCDTGEEF